MVSIAPDKVEEGIQAPAKGSAAKSPAGMWQGPQPVLPQMLERCVAHVQDVKDRVQDLRQQVKLATSHREKCCAVLSAAMAACLALEQVLYSGVLDGSKEGKLHQLCQRVIAAVDLGESRVKVYGAHSRIKRYIKLPRRGATESKFDEVTMQLEETMAKIWKLTEGSTVARPSMGSAGNNLSRDWRRRVSMEASLAAAKDMQRLPQLQASIMSRISLRLSNKLGRIKCLLLIPSEEFTSGQAAAGKVWWYLAGAFKGGQLAVHDLETQATEEIAAARSGPGVTCMHLCPERHVWVGYRDGSLRIWSHTSQHPLCKPIDCFQSEVRCIATDDQGKAWVGSEAGELVCVEQVSTNFEQGGLMWLEMRASYRWQSSLRTRSLGIKPGKGAAADGSPVCSIHVHNDRVWSSRGTSTSASLQEWSIDGEPTGCHDLANAGAANAMAVVPEVLRVQRDSSQGTLRTGVGYQLLTGHDNGEGRLWDISCTPAQPLARLRPAAQHPIRAIITCGMLGVFLIAHADGTCLMRPLFSSQRITVPSIADGTQLPFVTVPQASAVFKAHRSGLNFAAGGETCLLTASQSGRVVLWPEKELRSLAESSGLYLSSRKTLLKLDEKVSIDRVMQEHQLPPASYKLFPVPEANGTSSDTDARVSLSSERPAQSLAQSAAGSLAYSRGASLGGGSLASMGSLASLSHAQAKRELIEEMMQMLRTEQSLGTSQSPFSLPPNGVTPEQGQLATADSLPARGTGSKEDSSDKDSCMELSQIERVTSGESAEASGRTEGARARSTSDFFHDGASNWIINFSELTFKKQIGAGSIGRVHLGRWHETDVAIKVLNSLEVLGVASFQPRDAEVEKDEDGEEAGQLPKSPTTYPSSSEDQSTNLRTLEREVGILSAIRHPNVVLFMGVCLEPPCLVTEWCARGSLFDVLTKAAKTPSLAPQLDWARRIAIALDAAKGMLQLHSHRPPILHRDLKSPNLLVDKHWRCKVADFNLSRVMDSEAVVSSFAANNPRWLAPEVVRSHDYSSASDVFSFGIVMWELLTWQLPWESLGPFQIMMGVTQQGLRPEIPADPSTTKGGTFVGMPAYLALMQACWQEDVAARPSFEAVITQLRALSNDLHPKGQRGPSGASHAAAKASAGARAGETGQEEQRLGLVPPSSSSPPPQLSGVLSSNSTPEGWSQGQMSREASGPVIGHIQPRRSQLADDYGSGSSSSQHQASAPQQMGAIGYWDPDQTHGYPGASIAAHQLGGAGPFIGQIAVREPSLPRASSPGHAAYAALGGSRPMHGPFRAAIGTTQSTGADWRRQSQSAGTEGSHSYALQHQVRDGTGRPPRESHATQAVAYQSPFESQLPSFDEAETPEGSYIQRSPFAAESRKSTGNSQQLNLTLSN